MDEEEVKEKKKPAPVPVTIIKVDGDSALVEYGGKRVYVPASSVKDGAVSPVTLSRGIPHGVPFEELSEALAADLHAIGIWTRQDLSRRMRDAWQTARGHGIDIADLNRLAAKGG